MQSRVVPRFNSSATGLIARENLTRPLTVQEKENLIHLDKLKYFLATAPSMWPPPASGSPHSSGSLTDSSGSFHSSMNRFLLPSTEYVTCVLWNHCYHIMGTDTRALAFCFEAFGRPVIGMKKKPKKVSSAKFKAWG
ncbi:STE-domain-containing protein [Rhizopogon salebrosus TDB-379]|nr:STE-domain-containing protein [Rhizopogon salebrosus TDB-379]